MGYVCLLEIHLHFPDNGSLKGKRKELSSLKAQLQRRFGAAVAETDHHDLWQRSEVTAGMECGIVLENYPDPKEGDVIEAYEIKQVEQTLG